jgi:flagellar export protein FliJ
MPAYGMCPFSIPGPFSEKAWRNISSIASLQIPKLPELSGTGRSMLKDRLERIIGIKKRLMDDKEREIDEEKGKLDSVNRAIEAVDADVEKNFERMTGTSMKGNDFCVIMDYLEYLENMKCSLIVEKESVQEKIGVLKEELIDFMKEIKMLNTLRERIIATLKKSFNRREQKLLDDIALRIEEKRM